MKKGRPAAGLAGPPAILVPCAEKIQPCGTPAGYCRPALRRPRFFGNR